MTISLLAVALIRLITVRGTKLKNQKLKSKPIRTIMKNYTQAPLPFQGQKRRFLTPFKEALNGFSPTATYVDLFGGSGLLSHTVKRYYPDARVIWNDFDNYAERLESVEKTNEILKDLRCILDGYPDGKRITGEIRDNVLNRLKKEIGFVDYITISSSLCFSMNYGTSIEHFEKDSLYNNIRQNNYKCDGYLENVNRVQKDYRNLYAEYRNHNNVVFLVDPPYLSTDTTTYNKTDYWKLTDYLNVLKVIEDTSYFYFTSNKSQIIELCDWMETRGYSNSPFDGSTTVTIGAQLNYNSKYNDIMIYRNDK